MKPFHPRSLTVLVLAVSAIAAIGGEVDVVALPETVSAKTGEEINLFIQATNKSEKPVQMPSGVADSKGLVVPDACSVKVRVFKRVGLIAEETERLLDGKAVHDLRRTRKLAPGETIVYLVKVTPFQADAVGSYCVVTIDFGESLPEKIRVNLQRGKR